MLNLLLAEDNLPDALLVREAIQLERLPLDVHLVPDGDHALRFLEKAEHDAEAPCPHVVVLDLNLPKVDGLTVLKRIRSSVKFRDIPVLVVSSSDAPADRKGAAELNARYFRKPPSYGEFLKIGAVLKAILEGLSSGPESAP